VTLDVTRAQRRAQEAAEQICGAYKAAGPHPALADVFPVCLQNELLWQQNDRLAQLLAKSNRALRRQKRAVAGYADIVHRVAQLQSEITTLAPPADWPRNGYPVIPEHPQ
jgi:hypothetical protein